LPSVMRLRSLEDLCQLTPLQIEAIPLDHYKVRQDITKLGSFLELKEAIFGSQSLEKVIQRLLKELSLPATILSVLKKCCKVSFTFCSGKSSLCLKLSISGKLKNSTCNS
jgi:hypothetical protein